MIEFNEKNITKNDSINIFELKMEKNNLLWKYKDNNKIPFINNNYFLNNTYYELTKSESHGIICDNYLTLYHLDSDHKLNSCQYWYNNDNFQRMHDWKESGDYYKLESLYSLNNINEHINLFDYDNNINDYEYIEEENIFDLSDNICNLNNNIPEMDNVIMKDKYKNKDNEIIIDDMIDDTIDDMIERRIDPYDNHLYTKDEFCEYYGGDHVWDMQDPEKIYKLEKLDEFIEKYRDLNNQRFIFIYKQYDKIINL